ncbi:MAG: rhamnulokinase [Kiritimatiellaeota bacterium]|nr:rhamnulokinase [Kiritimatiellota bacterium]
MNKTFIAADLGAGSGRTIAGRYDGGRIALEVINRFDNVPSELGGHFYWNHQALFGSIRAGLAKAAATEGEIASVGVDSWGVDYALLDKGGRLLGLPYMYRDSRNVGLCDAVCERVGRREIYNRTGIQFMDINTLFQLEAESRESDSLLPKADRLLHTPDLMNYWLCGVKANEATMASTGQTINLKTRSWDTELLKAVGAPLHLFGEIIQPGVRLAPVSCVPGLKAPVVTVGSHDTASAVAAVPAPKAGHWAYLATGTWALMGLEITEPIINDTTYGYSYTHEGGVGGTFRFLKNITGMWIYQELRRAWKEAGEDIAFDDLTQLAGKEKPLVSLINPNDPVFASPGNMPQTMADYCTKTGQPVPQSKGAFVRCALESMVMCYREVWLQLHAITGIRRDGLNMIGGGVRNALHCQMTADALGAPVTCGPTEGAAMGNILAQMLASGDIRDIAQGRDIIRASTELDVYTPRDTAPWDEAYSRWQTIKARI